MTADAVDRPVVRTDQVTLGVLISQVSREEVDAAVAVCGVGEKRSDGKLPAHVILSRPDDHGCDLGGCVEDGVVDAAADRF